jgi:hypothetical protein
MKPRSKELSSMRILTIIGIFVFAVVGVWTESELSPFLLTSIQN